MEHNQASPVLPRCLRDKSNSEFTQIKTSIEKSPTRKHKNGKSSMSLKLARLQKEMASLRHMDQVLLQKLRTLREGIEDYKTQLHEGGAMYHGDWSADYSMDSVIAEENEYDSGKEDIEPVYENLPAISLPKNISRLTKHEYMELEDCREAGGFVNRTSQEIQRNNRESLYLEPTPCDHSEHKKKHLNTQ